MRGRLARWMLADAGLDDDAALRLFGPAPRGPRPAGILLHVLIAAVLITTLMVGGYAAGFRLPTLSAQAYASLYAPMLGGQAVVSALVLALGLNIIPTLRRRGTWDQVRTTAGGARAGVRAAWAHVVYHRVSGWLMVVVYAPRVFLLVLLLYDLTSFRGDYLAQVIGVHTPRIPAVLDIPLMGLVVTAAFVLPFTAVGLEAACALLLSTFLRSRQAIGMAQIGLISARIAWAVAPVVLFSAIISSTLVGGSSPFGTWIAGFASTVLGDWGLSGLHAAEIDRLWSVTPYSALIPVLAVGMAVLQSGLTIVVLNWAARRAQRLD
ncbi:MAG: hypothetical protein IPM16_08940 [Chloroflexi bacterium]|nr:hypothetical protein [Chloroflexota bacterium]